MKTKPALTDGRNAVREATLKVAKLRRLVEAEEKLAQAAKVRFKGAKKTWKHARKTARRSAKKLKRAEEHLAALAKQFKSIPRKPEPQRRPRRSTIKPAAQKPTRRLRRNSRTAMASPPTAVPSEPESVLEPAPDSGSPLP